MSLRRLSNTLLVCLAIAGAGVAQTQEDYFEKDLHRHGITDLKNPASTPLVFPAKTGIWRPIYVAMPINPVHMAMMHNGRILVIAGSGSARDPESLHAAVFDPSTWNVRTFSLEYDMFCNGMVVLPDGRPFVMGGTMQYPLPDGQGSWLGLPYTSLFTPSTGKFTRTATMSGGRWYPTGTVLSDGRVMVTSGILDNTANGFINRNVEIYDPATDRWTDAGNGFPGFALYPRQALLPNGEVFVSGSQPTSHFFDPKTFVWRTGPKTNFPLARNYGTSVLLPLTPANQFKPKVIILGGGPDKANITKTTEIIEPMAAQPEWKYGPPMIAPRMDLNATILPNGQVLVSGGSTKGEDPSTAVLQSEIYDPQANTLTPMAMMKYPRLYHSNTILLPDATVLATGSNPVFPIFEPQMENYWPVYLFNRDGSIATRPVIQSVGGPISYGGVFRISTPDAASIASVVLIRPGAPTHAFDMEQRLVALNFAIGSGLLNATAPADSRLAPPGYYMVFILNKAGVPSVAKFVLLQ